jgi:release factor glutamine methyltransferase
LDLCTGSGALVISLKNERPFLHVTASDISPGALETAALNAARLLLPSPHFIHSVRFIHSDLFENIHGKFDIIVSNPPYIPSGELSGLAPEVRGEPQLALDGGADGLELIRKIISLASEHLFPGGIILLEASPEQMPVIRACLAAHGFDAKIHKDLAGMDRVIALSAAV